MPSVMEPWSWSQSQSQSGVFKHFLVPTVASVTSLHVTPFDRSGVAEKRQGQATQMKRITRIKEAPVRRGGG